VAVLVVVPVEVLVVVPVEVLVVVPVEVDSLDEVEPVVAAPPPPLAVPVVAPPPAPPAPALELDVVVAVQSSCPPWPPCPAGDSELSLQPTPSAHSATTSQGDACMRATLPCAPEAFVHRQQACRAAPACARSS
jgi:hypothetical protein